MKHNQINFYLESPLNNNRKYPEPKSSSFFIPDWYKKMKAYPTKNDSGSMKACIPFRDALCAGYTIPLWQNMHFSKCGEDSSDYSWELDDDWNAAVGLHKEEQTQGSPLHETNQCRMALKFESPWIIETPPGYSCLLVQPLNYSENRFYIPSAIVDTDTYKIPISFPFIITSPEDNFYLEAGMPLVQIIPFKRESWKGEVGYDPTKTSESQNQRQKLYKTLQQAYQKFWWAKKMFK